MRANFDPNLKDYKAGDEITITGDSFHHLKNVIRIKEHEELLFLNGKGHKGVSEVLEISKRHILAKLNSLVEITDDRRLSLVLGVPKKEAFERILKISVELNLKNVFLYYSKYAQHKVEYSPRHDKLLISALEQSNGAYLPKVSLYDPKSLDAFERVLMSNRVVAKNDLKFSKDKEIAYFVGPEAGFSEDEEASILENSLNINLPSNILRAPTAVASGYGFITSRLAL